MSRTAVVLLVLVLIGGGMALLLRRASPPDDAGIEAQGIGLQGYHADGSPAWGLQAGSGVLQGDRGTLESVRLTLFEEGELPLVIFADRLSRETSGSVLSGAVRVERQEALVLHTEAMTWDERNGVLESGAVSVSVQAASIEAGSFHHDLRAGVTTLTRGVDAQVSQDGVRYVAHSPSAESTVDRLVLLEGVTVQADSGDHYESLRLELSGNPVTIHLIGGVSGTWQGTVFSAREASLETSGLRLSGGAVVDLDWETLEAPRDT